MNYYDRNKLNNKFRINYNNMGNKLFVQTSLLCFGPSTFKRPRDETFSAD